MNIEEALNTLIGATGADTNKISDGYHTFSELYAHRVELFIALCRSLNRENESAEYANLFKKDWIWKSIKHSDGTEAYKGWFVMGIDDKAGKQITYHLPISRWEECSFAKTLDQAPEWDGHTSADVLERLKQL